MAEIIRSKGTTPSEEYLAKLSNKTFLDLWSYPNVYRAPQKELCDLLVVCGDNIIIFSDKKIGWSENKNIDVAWSRWYNRAISESVRQLRRAENWINNHPSEIFLDSKCTQKFPLKIPPASSRKIHLVIIALGAHEACSKFFSGDSGSFMLCPNLSGEMHTNTSHQDYLPFSIGDVNPGGTFVHVVNDVTLDIMMNELDTLADFTCYLDKKEKFFRSGHLANAAGEEDLLAYYLKHLVEKEHDFTHPDNRPWEDNEKIALDIGVYDNYIKNPQYSRKKEADKSSYIWDRLIEAFTEHMLNGTTIVGDGESFDVSKHEVGVRLMAQEPRLMRRMLGGGILGVLKDAHLHDRIFRSMLPPTDNTDRDIAYAFMTLAIPKKKLAGGYQQYRRVRANMLLTYCMGILKKYPHLKKIVGIASEPPPTLEGQGGSSEDMVLVEQPQVWTSELEADLAADCKAYNIMQEGRFHAREFHVEEYPSEK